jgi:3',5'-nucleoside bisphosphate phosphatase
MIDLHIHSTCSDGIYKPAELVRMAHALDLVAIGLADHDSVAGIDEALSSAASLELEIVPAVELSVAYRNYQDVHLLGYYIDHHDQPFQQRLAIFQERRETRGLRIIERINEKLTSENRGTITSEEVLALAEGALGRPHIARILLERGYVGTMQEAFRNYLEPCNVPKEYLAFTEALTEIKRLGGVAVLAHPQSITSNRHLLGEILEDMASQGLDGLEAFNTMSLQDDSSFLQRTATKLGLLTTGGSDFHGTEEGIAMGTGRGALVVRDELLAAMKEYRRRNRRQPQSNCGGNSC